MYRVCVSQPPGLFRKVNIDLFGVRLPLKKVTSAQRTQTKPFPRTWCLIRKMTFSLTQMASVPDITPIVDSLFLRHLLHQIVSNCASMHVPLQDVDHSIWFFFFATVSPTRKSSLCGTPNAAFLPFAESRVFSPHARFWGSLDRLFRGCASALDW